MNDLFGDDTVDLVAHWHKEGEAAFSKMTREIDGDGMSAAHWC